MSVKGRGLDEYFKEVRSWETDKVEESIRSKKLAWRIAIGACVLACISVLAVASLAPLKHVEPFVIRVDNSTGIVDVVNSLKNGKSNYEEAVNKYFVQLYIRYREGYSKELTQEYYENVGIMSVGLEQQKYFAGFNPKNPHSPINVYGPYTKVKVTILGTSFIKPTIALVRYTKEIERGLDKPEISHWAATVTFKYSASPMKESDRSKNPLGFQVVEYRNDPETPEASKNKDK
jgi:type IV secretion system protein VirB8